VFYIILGRLEDGWKSRPLVNADAFLLTNRGSEALFRCQVSGVRNDEQRRWNLTPSIREGINMGYFLKPYYGQF
jgi:hypothetical protein